MRGLVGGVLLLAGQVLFLVGVAGLVRRRVSLVGVTSRREGGVAVGTALAILLVGGAISPQGSTPSDTLAVRAAAGPCGADPVAFPREGAGTARGPVPTAASPDPSGRPAPADRLTGADPVLPLPAGAQEAVIDRHIDGDTLALRGLAVGPLLSSTSQITVRLIEIDTPRDQAAGHPGAVLRP